MEKSTEHRPWGMFEQFCKNESCTVKIITVQPHESLSLQYHQHREEFWRVLIGPAMVVIGEEAFEGVEGDEFFVPRGAKHRISAGKNVVKILEIAFGMFDEKDIVRLEDKYQRK